MRARDILPALGHAASGSLGTAVSTAATYPLDLVNTRLKVQRLLAREAGAAAAAEEEGPKKYAGVVDALRSVARDEGGARALYRGLGSDLAKSAADSFLFFLFYTWLRSRRLLRPGRAGRRRRRLGGAEELAVAAAAGACARFVTMPVANVVARMQTAPLVEGAEGKTGEAAAAREVLRRIWRERGVAGLWAGFSAALVLTLNPSITFFMDNALRGLLLVGDGDGPADHEAVVGAGATFLLAAVSKAVATAATYPFQTAKARLQVSPPSASPSSSSSSSSSPPRDDREDKASDVAGGGGGSVGENDEGGAHDDAEKDGQVERVGGGDEKSRPGAAATIRDAAAAVVGGGARSLARNSIFATVAGIVRAEGAGALYAGLGGELLKAFFGHGITMLSKDLLHRLVVWLYFVLAGLWRARRRTGSSGGPSPPLSRLLLSSASADGVNLTAANAGRQIWGVTEEFTELVINVLDGSQRRVIKRQ